MYERFFGFNERPFDLTPNPRYLVETDVHKEAISNLVYAIGSRKGIALLIGEAGTGKTTVIRSALSAALKQVHSVHLHNPTLTKAEFVQLMSTRFGLTNEAAQSKASFLLEVESLLLKRHAAGESTLLVVDEAQSLSYELLEEVRLLANLETDETKLLTVVLAGQPELAARLNEAVLRQLKQRIALRCLLRPLTLQETGRYIAGRIRAAGGIGAHVFTREAVTLIYERSGGIPRTISVLCDNALLTAFALGQRPVTSRVVTEVCADFDIAAANVAETAQSASAAAVQEPAVVDDGRLLAVQPDLRPIGGKQPAEPAADVKPPTFGALNLRRRFRIFG